MYYTVAGISGLLYGFGEGYLKLAFLILFALLGVAHKSNFLQVLRVTLVFYGVACIPLFILITDFTTSKVNPLVGYLVAWLVCSVLTALFFAKERTFLVTVATVMGFLFLFLLPPLDIITFMSPLWMAGLLFPGTGYVGLLFLVLLIASLLNLPKFHGQVLSQATLAAALVGNAIFLVFLPMKVESAIDGVSTARDNEISNAMPFVVFQRSRDFVAAEQSSAEVVIFPENAFGEWTDVGVRSYSNLDNKTLLAGAFVQDDARQQYVIGDFTNGSVIYRQRRPLPNMIRPGRWDSVNTEEYGPSIVNLSGKRMAFFICWESLSPVTVIESLKNKPDVMVMIANTDWTHSLLAGDAMIIHIKSWSRLFSVPIVTAVNSHA